LELAFYFPGLAMDEKFAYIKFRHVTPSLGDYYVVEVQPRRLVFVDRASMAVVACWLLS
jgi:hypothetical protein